MAKINAGHYIVKALVDNGITHAFGVPGESYLPVLDGLHEYRDRITFVACRHESGAAFMAEAHGKLTGKPGVCMVTRGPGATNASIGVHAAFQDSTPMILLIGQVGTDTFDREGFQEVDFRAMYRPLAKWVAQVERADRLPEYMNRALQTAVNGRPGPVVLVLPEDVLSPLIDAPDLPAITTTSTCPDPSAVAAALELLATAQQPLLLLGGSGWSADSLAGVQAFAESWHLPVACAWRFQSLFNNDHALYVGDVGLGINPQLMERVKAADVIFALGPRLGEITTGSYEWIKPPRPTQRLIHWHVDANELGRVFAADVAICSTLDSAGIILSSHNGIFNSTNKPRWQAWTDGARKDYESFRAPVAKVPGTVNPSEVIAELRRQLADDAIVTNGAGNFAGWLHRFFAHRQWRTQLAPSSGCMGYGLPAAVAAKITHPTRQVVCVAGDGDVMMSIQELATAAQHGAGIVLIIFNNGIYGTIRMHQEMSFPARVLGSNLHNPDFVALAKSFGFKSWLVSHTHEFAATLSEALASSTGGVIELTIDPEAITARTTLSGLRATALAKFT